MSKQRKVAVYEYKQVQADGKSYSEKVEIGRGVFHQFGVSYEEFEEGPGNFTTAIVEMPDGKVLNIYAENIRFLDKETPND